MCEQGRIVKQSKYDRVRDREVIKLDIDSFSRFIIVQRHCLGRIPQHSLSINQVDNDVVGLLTFLGVWSVRRRNL